MYGATTPGPRPRDSTGAAATPPQETRTDLSVQAADSQLGQTEAPATDQPAGQAEPKADGEPEGVGEPEEQSFYDPEVTYGAAIDPDLKELAAQANLPEEHVSALRKGAAQVFDELQIPVAHAATLYSLHAHYLREPASDELEKTWRKEAHQALRERYGAETAERLAAAREYVKARPGLHQMLLHSGLGSHPRVVDEIVARASSWKARNAQKEKRK
jgi:hypothetical protein